MAHRTAALLLLLLLPCLWVPGCSGLSMEGNITEVVMVVENGTLDAVVLDCPYELTEDDKAGLVIKWYMEGNVHPIFQWIPNSKIDKPQLSDMDDVIDVDYVVSENPLNRHRALRLLTPTTELTAVYTCSASSFYEEATFQTRLIVYSLPSSLTLSVEELSPGGNFSVVCESGPAYPQPHLQLLQTRMGDDSSELEVDTIIDNMDGLYNITVEALLPPSNFDSAATIECRLVLPYTNLSLTEEIRIEPVTAVEEAAVVGTVMEETAVEHHSVDTEGGADPPQKVVAGASTSREALSGGVLLGPTVASIWWVGLVLFYLL